MKDKSELVGLWIATRGSIRSKLGLVPLNEVLGLAASAIDVLVEMPRCTLERGDDVADVETFGCRLDASGNAALLIPAFGTIAQGDEGAQLCRCARRPPD